MLRPAVLHLAGAPKKKDPAAEIDNLKVVKLEQNMVGNSEAGGYGPSGRNQRWLRPAPGV